MWWAEMKWGHLCPSPAHTLHPCGLSSSTEHSLEKALPAPTLRWYSRPAQEELSASDLHPECHHCHRFLHAIQKNSFSVKPYSKNLLPAHLAGTACQELGSYYTPVSPYTDPLLDIPRRKVWQGRTTHSLCFSEKE